MNPKELLRKEKFNKIIFYDYKTKLLKNVLTACVLLNKEKNTIEARGVAICSVGDSFDRKEGKDRAFYRAIEALRTRKNNGNINPVGREGFVTRKVYGVKPEQEDDFEDTLKELYNINPNSDIIITQCGKKKKFVVEIPTNYPMTLANKVFKYKSQYRPNPSNQYEAKLLEQEGSIK
jgi:hypothetical protein